MTRSPTDGGDQLAELQQELAVELIGHLCGLEQAGRLYELNNDMVRKLLEEILATVRRFVQASRVEMVLTMVGYSVFINRRLVRLDFADYRRAQQLKHFWDQFGIGELRLPEQPTLAGLTEFAGLLFGAMADPNLRPSLFTREPGGVRLVPVLGDDRPGTRLAPHEFTLRSYCALMALARKMVERVRAGKRPPMLRIKRTLQVMVDLLEGQQNLVLTLCQTPAFQTELAGHLVSTAILSLSVGRELGLSRVELMALGTAALLHDLPKAGLKDEALNRLEQPAAMPPEDRQRVEGLWLKVLRRVVDLGGFTQEMLARLVTLYEAQLEFGCTDLFPGQPQHSLYSRIIAACDLYNTVKWDRPGKRQRTAHFAMMTLLQTALGGQNVNLEPAVALAVLRTVGLYPLGSPVLLTTGEIGVVSGRQGGDMERPEVHLVFDPQGRPVDGPVLDLSRDPNRQVLWSITLGPLGVNPVACFEPRADNL